MSELASNCDIDEKPVDSSEISLGPYPGRFLWIKYQEKREEAINNRKELPNLEEIQEAVGEHFKDSLKEPLNYDSPKTVDEVKERIDEVKGRFKEVLDFLNDNYEGCITQAEIDASYLCIYANFGLWEEYLELKRTGMSVHPDAQSKFAFVVPARAGRNKPEYGKESELVAPISRYMPNTMRAWLFSGMPTILLDEYDLKAWPTSYLDDGLEDPESNPRSEATTEEEMIRTHQGLGLLALAVVREDMLEDMNGDKLKAFETVVNNVNETLDYLKKRHGVTMVGMGAILPLYMRFLAGNQVKDEKMIVTNGHAGTVYGILKYIQEAINRGYVKIEEGTPLTIGEIGLGGIGLPAAQIVAEHYPDSPVILYDKKSEKLNAADKAFEDREHTMANNVIEVLQNCDIVVSAATTQIDLDEYEKEYLNGEKLDLTGKIIIDDSQPGCFDQKQVEARGGRVVWVITQNKMILRKLYDYGFMLNPTDGFGCEAEVSILAVMYLAAIDSGMPEEEALELVRLYAVNDRLTVKDVEKIGMLFEYIEGFNFGESDTFQIMGKEVKSPDLSRVDLAA